MVIQNIVLFGFNGVELNKTNADFTPQTSVNDKRSGGQFVLLQDIGCQFSPWMSQWGYLEKLEKGK